MDIAGIIVKYLKDNNFDGLAGDECGCEISDLMPCATGECPTNCEPGYKIPCSDGCEVGPCDFHISPKKPKVKGDNTIPGHNEKGEIKNLHNTRKEDIL